MIRSIPFHFRNTGIRFGVFLGIAAILAGLCFISYRLGKADHLAAVRMLASPAQYAGTPIAVSYGKVMDVNPRETTLQFKTCWVNIRPRIPESRLGDIISLEGTVAPDTSIRPARIHFHAGQGIKLHVSVGALAIFIIVFFCMYRWDFRQWAFIERGHRA